MTPLQIFSAIFIASLLLSWVILADAYRKAPLHNEGDEIVFTDETNFD